MLSPPTILRVASTTYCMSNNRFTLACVGELEGYLNYCPSAELYQQFILKLSCMIRSNLLNSFPPNDAIWSPISLWVFIWGF